MNSQTRSTKEKKLTEARVGELHYREFVGNALVGIVDNTLDGTILYANQVAARMAGYESSSEVHEFGSEFFWRFPERRKDFVA